MKAPFGRLGVYRLIALNRCSVVSALDGIDRLGGLEQEGRWPSTSHP
jgi:hypothetical protein